MPLPPVCELDPADFFSVKEMEDYSRIFKSQPDESYGKISFSSLLSATMRLRVKCSEDEAKGILDQFKYDHSHGLSFEAMLIVLIKLQSLKIRADLIDHSKYLSASMQGRLEALYREYDGEGKGISTNSLKNLFERLGLELSSDQVAAVMRDVDSDGSGLVELFEFMRMIAKITGTRKHLIPREYLSKEEWTDYYERFEKARGEKDTIDRFKLFELFRDLGVVSSIENIELASKEYFESNERLNLQSFLEMMTRLSKKQRYRRVSVGQLSSGVTLSSLKDEGLSAIELLNLGHPTQSLLEAGFAAKELLSVGARDLLRSVCDIEMLRDAGVGLSELVACGVSFALLRNAGFSAEALRLIALKNNS